MAAMRTVEELLARAPRAAYDITVFGAEPHANYNRIMLSSVLAGEKTVDDIVINPRDWYDENGITLLTGDAGDARSTAAAKTVTLASGRAVALRQAAARAPARSRWRRRSPGWACPACCAFRDIADVDAMLAAAERTSPRGGDRRRPAGPRSGLGPEAARHVGRASCI